jgi:hypothetical protein
MTLFGLLAAALFAFFIAISLFLLVARLRTPGRRVDVEVGWLVFDVVFGLTALALVAAGVDGALWIVLSILVARRLVEMWLRRREEPAPQ